ncbi:MAG TPA: DUF1800 domain-containing protein [Sphingomonas sp.]|nr:DUF1800 domain-containing protein [Sphingomonas sp.]
MADANIALNRFGLGARPDERAPDDAKRWLTGQLDRFNARPAPIAAAPGSGAAVAAYVAGRQQKAAARKGADPAAAMAARKAAQQAQRQAYVESVGARMEAALVTPAPFVERMVWFWANHFAVSTDKAAVAGLAGPFEFEAIRPHVLGTFGQMLGAVERHPAMLLYLDQAQSIGPDSRLGSRIDARGKRKAGINENLGREIMELHTLGVRTGYSQADVTEFARALTGWTVAGLGRGQGLGTPGSFVFAERLHEPGARTIRGKRYAEEGEKQAQAVLDDLAASPATATHIATKLARHFAGDTPPQPLVDRLEAAFLKTGGDLPSLYRVLIESPEAWAPAPAKFKTPWEWSVSSLRALGTRAVPARKMTGLLGQLGQPVWKPGSPAGYDDIAASWAGPDAVLRRVEAAQRLAARAGDVLDARQLAATLYPAAVTPATATQLARAESRVQALTLLLVAPESMRR